MPEIASKGSRASWLAGKLLLAAAVLLSTCALIEVGYRALLRVKDRPYDRTTALETMARLADQMTRREARPMQGPRDGVIQSDGIRQVLHPYLAYEAAHNFQRVARDAAYFAHPSSQNFYDVLILGGSVAAHFGNEMAKEIGDLLHPLPMVGQRRVRVHSYGRGSYKQPQQVIMLTWLLTLGFEPDLVINLDGFNEVALANQNYRMRGQPFYPSIPQWAPLARGGFTDPEVLDLAFPIRELQREGMRLAERAQRSFWMRSALVGSLRHRELRHVHAEWVVAQRTFTDHLFGGLRDEVVLGPPHRGDPSSAMSSFVRAWFDGSRMLHAICSARGILYLHCLQPTLHDSGSKPLTAAELAVSGTGPAWVEGAQQGYPLLRQGGKALARQGIHFLDASRIFQDVEESLYYDACHFDRHGNLLLLEWMVRELAERMDAAEEATHAEGEHGAPRSR